MICSKCKKFIPNGSVQCPECGADLKSSNTKDKSKNGLYVGFYNSDPCFCNYFRCPNYQRYQ